MPRLDHLSSSTTSSGVIKALERRAAKIIWAAATLMRGGGAAVSSGTLDWVDPVVDSTTGDTGPVATGGSMSPNGRGRRGT